MKNTAGLTRSERAKIESLSPLNQLKLLAYIEALSLKETIQDIPARYVIYQLSKSKKMTALPTASGQTR